MTRLVVTPTVVTNDRTRTTNADAMTIQNELRAGTIVNGTMVVVPKRILTVTARHLRRETTRILNPVTCMAQNPSIRVTSANVIQKMHAQRASLVTTLKNVDTTRITMTIDIAAAGTIPQVNATCPFQLGGTFQPDSAGIPNGSRVPVL
jgi:hypothetical protein